MTEPTTAAGKRLLAAMPYHTATEKDLWGRLIAAIEAEAVAAERARIAKAVGEWASGGTNLCNSCYMPMARHDADCRVAAVLAIVEEPK